MKPYIILMIGFLSFPLLYAQDRQNWDQAASGEGALLGGLNIAGVRDYSAVYYNPGAMGFLTREKLNVNFNTYGIKDFKFVNGGGPGIHSRYTRVSLYPASLAGSLPFLGDSINRLGYMIYANGYSYVRISERFEGYEDVVPTRHIGGITTFEGNEFLINQGKVDALLQEVSVGFGYARKISPNASVGISILGAYRDQTKIRTETYSAFDTTNQHSATTDLNVDIDYWAVRFYAKIGLALEWEKVKLGITLTTPSIPLKLASGGTDGASLTSTNVYVTEDSLGRQKVYDVLASDRQEGIPVKYKTPFSIAAGIEYIFSEETSIHLAFQLYTPLSPYVVMQPEDDNFVRNSPDVLKPINSAEFLRVHDAMKTILNGGIALKQKLSDMITGYAAIRTDFSNADFKKIDGLFVGFTDFNVYHFTVGGSAELNNTFIGVGFEYSHGERTDFTQIFNFPSSQAEPNDIVMNLSRGTTKAIYNNFNLFFAITQLL